ncbi:MAG TPA: transketolase C-terminal domain-containing protein [Candidatus Methylacidiphilales bacterium]|nr:transketolase C-terminal domain-containing protein [Candidatus Methylacidiphilales bacterium]
MERVIKCSEAIREALDQEMELDERVIVMGQGVDDAKGMWGTTLGLQKKYGAGRVFDTPLAEDGMTGVAIGAALGGLRPVHTHIRMDFLVLAMNQLVNIAAKSRYMYGGSVKVPLVVRAVIGRSWGQGAQHSQALHAWFAHIPGIKVVMPATAYDAKGCLIQAIRDDNPVLFVEHRLVHQAGSHVPSEPYAVPLGRARILVPGSQLTIVATGHMVMESMRAQATLEKAGLSIEVIDPVTISPLDTATIFASLEKTGRLLVVDNAWLSCGFSAEIIARAVEHFPGGGIQYARMGFAPVTCPTTKVLEKEFYPDARRIAARAAEMIQPGLPTPVGPQEEAPEITRFKGPF